MTGFGIADAPPPGIGHALDERRAELIELAPLLRRAIGLDPAATTRLRATSDAVSALVRLPFDVVVGRSVARFDAAPAHPASESGPPPVDQCTVSAAALVGWLDGRATQFPLADEPAWRGGVPPLTRWLPVDLVPAAVVRDLVAQAGQVLQAAAARDGVAGARPRAAVTDALLDSTVLTVIADEPAGRTPDQVALTLRPLGAMVRMGLVPAAGHVRVDISGRWVRLASPLGSAYGERPGLGLMLLS